MSLVFVDHALTTTLKRRQALVSSSRSSNNPWILYTRATHLVTTDSQGFHEHEAYHGTDEISLGDGNKISITHTGTINLKSSNYPFQLPHAICATQIKQKLIFVSLFFQDNLTSVEFFPSSFSVKDLSTGALLVRRRTRNRLYEWPCGTNIPYPQINGVTSSRVLQALLKNFSLPVSGSKDFAVSNSCSCNKSHRLLFYHTSLVSKRPFQLVFNDLWGPSPTLSADKKIILPNFCRSIYKIYLVVFFKE